MLLDELLEVTEAAVEELLEELDGFPPDVDDDDSDVVLLLDVTLAAVDELDDETLVEDDCDVDDVIDCDDELELLEELDDDDVTD